MVILGRSPTTRAGPSPRMARRCCRTTDPAEEKSEQTAHPARLRRFAEDRSPAAAARLRESAAHGEIPAGRSEAVLSGARGAHPRALARAPGFRPVARRAGIWSALGVLRRPADRERPPGLASRSLAGLQGHLSA